MHDALTVDLLRSRVEALEHTVNMLTERIAALSFADGPQEYTTLGLTPAEARVLHVLVTANIPLTGARLYQALYSGRFHPADQCNIRRCIGALRRKLASRGIAISNARGRRSAGYFISPSHKSLIIALVKRNLNG